MTRAKYLLTAGLIVILIIVGAFFVFNHFVNNKESESIVYTTPTGNLSQTIENPEITEDSTTTEYEQPVVNNTDLADVFEPTEDMQEIIEENKSDLNNEEVLSGLAQTYPSNVIPIYKADNAADSADIITSNGKPGWTANYGSDATVTDIKDFYVDLMKSTTGYQTEQNGETYMIVGTIDNCYVQISVSPNNPQQTGLNDMSNVSIFIERN